MENWERGSSYRTSFLFTKKFLKLSKMVYTKNEIKNGMTKERSVYFAMTLFMKFFVLVFGDCTVRR